MGIIKDFRDFLKEYKIVGLAVAFIMGAAVTALVQALVNNMVMPLINPIVPKGGWQNATIMFGPQTKQVILGWGAFVGALINFLIIALVVFLIVKVIDRKPKEEKK